MRPWPAILDSQRRSQRWALHQQESIDWLCSLDPQRNRRLAGWTVGLSWTVYFSCALVMTCLSRPVIRLFVLAEAVRWLGGSAAGGRSCSEVVALRWDAGGQRASAVLHLREIGPAAVKPVACAGHQERRLSPATGLGTTPKPPCSCPTVPGPPCSPRVLAPPFRPACPEQSPFAVVGHGSKLGASCLCGARCGQRQIPARDNACVGRG